jgi:ATP-binding cassette subfamily F protein 3
VQVTRVGKAFGSLPVLDGVSFRVAPGERLAVVGRNGTGKTTLLRILAGELAPDEGEVSVPGGGTVAVHDLRPPVGRPITLAEYVGEGLAGARAAERRLEELERRMADGDASEAVLRDYDRAQAELERHGGYAWRAWQERVMRGLRLPAEWSERQLSELSGGELTRAALARALVSRPDVLLLDEPTNHLDIASVEWLESALLDMPAAVVLVSHDRWFLQSVATGVLELSEGRSKLWPVDYARYRRERAAAADQEQREARRQAAEIARLERFVERWRAGTKARQAASRAKRLERMEPPRPPTRERAMEFGFPPTERVGRVVIDAAGLDVGFGETVLLSGVDLAVEREQRVAVVGPNGAGKTTLVETLIGLRPALRGRVSIGHRVQLAYFSQHAAELDPHRTVLETMLRVGTLKTAAARTLLGSFLFSGGDVERKVESLSGGERARLALALLIAGGGNVLVLDEPTNHLDAESREALEDALGAYQGTVVLISHDRALIDAVATHTLSVEDGRALLRHGNYSDLVAMRALEDGGGGQTRARAATPASGKTAGRAPGKTAGRSTRAAHAERTLARRVEQLEERVAAVEGELQLPETLADQSLLSALGEQHRDLQEQLAWAMREWERAAEEALAD